jgi:alpha-tubulin suppressor-like RCC1 family protein
MAIKSGNGDITFDDDTIQSTAYVPRTITKIVKGYNNFSAMTSDGKIYSWGYNAWGGIGDGMTTTALPTEIQLKGTDRNNISGCPFSYTPTDLVSMNDSKYVLCENAARTDGVLLVWGYNGYGQLGLGNTTQQNYPKLSVGTAVSKLYYPDNHYEFNSTSYPFSTAYMKKTDGTFWCVGYNGTGQLANGTVTNSSTWIALTPPTGKTISNIWVGSSTNSCTFCKTTDNLIYGIGYNITGALGLGNTTQQNSWVQVTYFNAITDVIDIQTGDYDGGNYMWTAVLTASGNIYTCGNNTYGQLGDGTVTQRSTFAQVSLTKPVKKMVRGSTCIYVIFTDNTYARWGENTYGQLGNGTATNSSTPIYSSLTVSNVWCTSGVNGSHQTNVFILDTAGILYGCGRNNTGSLGLGHATLNVSTLTRIPFPKTDVADVLGTATNDTTCIRCTTGDKVYVCGYNGNNELGSYPNNTRYRFKQLTLG